MRARFFSRQFAVFLLSGGLAALVNFGSRMLYSRVVDFSLAVVLAYLSGMVTAFLLLRRFVFQGGRHSVRRSVFYFFLVNFAGLAQTWLLSLFLADYALPGMGIDAHAHEIAHAAGILAPVFTSFIGHKYLTFQKRA